MHESCTQRAPVFRSRCSPVRIPFKSIQFVNCLFCHQIVRYSSTLLRWLRKLLAARVLPPLDCVQGARAINLRDGARKLAFQR